MNILQALHALGPIDFRAVRRDSTLSWMIFIPLLCALVLRWGLLPLTARLLEQYGFDLESYYPVLLAYFFVIMTPIVFGTLIGFLLLDEKDDRTITALQVTPLLNAYLAYRVVIPVLLTFVMMFLIFPLSELDDLPWSHILMVAIVAAPLSPMFALYLASIAQNKVQGFALMKLSGFLFVVPVLAFFTHSGWELAFGLIPTYWPMKVYWLLTSGHANDIWVYVIVALLYQSAITALFTNRLNAAMRR